MNDRIDPAQFGQPAGGKERALEAMATAKESLMGGTKKLKDYIDKQPARALAIALGVGGDPGMGYQKAMNGLRFRKGEGILESLGGLGGDVASLVELQAKLATVDLKEAIGRATVPTTALIVSAVIFVATIPILLLGLAFGLATLGIAQWAALLITGGVFAAGAGVVGWLATVRFLKSFESFRRSREELVRNVNWLRMVAIQSGRPVERPTH